MLDKYAADAMDPGVGEVNSEDNPYDSLAGGLNGVGCRLPHLAEAIVVRTLWLAPSAVTGPDGLQFSADVNAFYCSPDDMEAAFGNLPDSLLNAISDYSNDRISLLDYMGLVRRWLGQYRGFVLYLRCLDNHGDEQGTVVYGDTLQVAQGQAQRWVLAQHGESLQ